MCHQNKPMVSGETNYFEKIAKFIIIWHNVSMSLQAKDVTFKVIFYEHDLYEY